MDFSKAQIQAVFSSSLAQSSNQKGLTEDEQHDLAWEIFMDYAPTAWQTEAEMDKGAFGILARGVPGAYFYQAMEFDDDGAFDTLGEAIAAETLRFGELFINDGCKTEG